MTSYEFGEIVLVPFPFTDQSASKQRPAVVVSSAAYNRERQDVILMPVTSQVRSPVKFGEVEVRAWQRAGLLNPSVIKPVLATAEKGLVRRKLGRLDTTDAASLRSALATIVG
jgi:mRNA interferase MazF